jgi:hypothetical protein
MEEDVMRRTVRWLVVVSFALMVLPAIGFADGSPPSDEEQKKE